MNINPSRSHYIGTVNKFTLICSLDILFLNVLLTLRVMFSDNVFLKKWWISIFEELLYQWLLKTKRNINMLTPERWNRYKNEGKSDIFFFRELFYLFDLSNCSVLGFSSSFTDSQLQKGTTTWMGLLINEFNLEWFAQIVWTFYFWQCLGAG